MTRVLLLSRLRSVRGPTTKTYDEPVSFSHRCGLLNDEAKNVKRNNVMGATISTSVSTFARQFPSQQNPKSPQWAYPSWMVYPSNAPFQKLYHYGVWVIFLHSTKKKTGAEAMKKKEKRETRPLPPLKRVEIRSSNKKTTNVLSVSPFPPSPLNTPPSIRSGFDRVPTSCEPLFGLATQITKVCYTLPTQNSTYQPYSRKKMIKISDHGEDHTPWAIWEHHWRILNYFF